MCRMSGTGKNGSRVLPSEEEIPWRRFIHERRHGIFLHAFSVSDDPDPASVRLPLQISSALNTFFNFHTVLLHRFTCSG